MTAYFDLKIIWNAEKCRRVSFSDTTNRGKKCKFKTLKTTQGFFTKSQIHCILYFFLNLINIVAFKYS